MTLATDFRAFVAEFKASLPAAQASKPLPVEMPQRPYVYKPSTTCSLCGDPSDRQVCERCNVGLTELGL